MFSFGPGGLGGPGGPWSTGRPRGPGGPVGLGPGVPDVHYSMKGAVNAVSII